jgi:hypothetical protein
MTGAVPPEAKSKEVAVAAAAAAPQTSASSSPSSHDVGVTIARKKAKRLASSPNPRKKTSKQPLTALTSQRVTPKKSKGSSWEVFLEGTTLYVLCLAAPALLGLVVRWYEGWSNLQKLQHLAHRAAFGASHGSAWYNIYFSTWSYVCDSLSLSSSWCTHHSSSTALEGAKRLKMVASLQAQDAHLSDLAIVIILSLSMALIRILLVHLLVPRYLTSGQRLEALVRCKSIHLLSAAYPPSLTPNHNEGRTVVAVTAFNRQQPDDRQQPEILPFLPDLQNSKPTEERFFAPRQYNEPPELQTHVLSTSPPPTNPATASLADRIPRAFSSMMNSIVLSLNRSGHLALGHELAVLYDVEELKDSDRLFSAPRYATAVFRSLYCLASCSIALLFFQQANFWPTYLGGHGQTAKCWDLSGGTTLSFDSDFDHRNAVLRRYFLVQASYHLHSGAFHVLSVLLLWWWKLQERPSPEPESSSTHQQPHVISVRSSTRSYVRSLLQHVVAIALIAGAYLFSSLRRLGAIAMFAFDLSSLSLHFLQICMNAPETSPLRNPELILWIHRAWVIPMFLYTRFFVWPFLVWYSAVIESKQWLQQLESTLVPNSANYMRWVFHALLFYVIALNLVYFRRLLFHPHLKRILEEKKSNESRVHTNNTVETQEPSMAAEDDWEPLTTDTADVGVTQGTDWRQAYDQAIFVDRRGDVSTKTLHHRNSYRHRHGDGDMETTTLDTDESDSIFPIPSSTAGDDDEEEYVHVQRLSATPPRRR